VTNDNNGQPRQQTKNQNNPTTMDEHQAEELLSYLASIAGRLKDIRDCLENTNDQLQKISDALAPSSPNPIVSNHYHAPSPSP
jgi:hypothetical protein